MNTQELVDEVIRDARIPQGHNYRTPATLLGMADKAMETLIVPELLKVAGRYLAASADLPLVAGKSKYRLPKRHLRGESVERLDSSGNVMECFDRAEPTRVSRLANTSGPPRFWFFEASSVVVRPTPAESGGYLRITYARRPNALVLPDSAGLILTVNSTVDGVRLTFSPSGLLGVAEADVTADVVRGSPGFETVLDGAELTVNEVSPSTIDVEGLTADDVEANDWITLSGQSPVPQVPLAYHEVLAQAVVARVAKEMGKADAYQRAMGNLYGTPENPGGLMASARNTVAPRTRDSSVIVQRDW